MEREPCQSLSGNATSTSVTFTATGASNTNAPVMSNFNVASVTELPDMLQVWLQANVSNPNASYYSSVNEGAIARLGCAGQRRLAEIRDGIATGDQRCDRFR